MPDRFERLHVAGMTCTSCVARIENALNGVSDVQHVHVDLKQGTAMVSGSDSLSRETLVQAVLGAGYSVIADEVAEADTTTEPSSPTSAASFAPLLVAVALIGLGSLAAGGGEGFMARFMGGFFLVFGGLKLLDLARLCVRLCHVRPARGARDGLRMGVPVSRSWTGTGLLGRTGQGQTCTSRLSDSCPFHRWVWCWP